MTTCYIYDAVRTPRGRGRAGGGLNSVSPVDLASAPLRALQERHHLDTEEVADVVYGCVEPVGEQGGDIGRIAVLNAGWDQSVPGVQLSRFCASGLEAVNVASAKIMAGMGELAIGGGVESMSRVKMGASGGPWATNPQVAANTAFIPQGISADLIASLEGFSRQDCDAFAAESQRRAAKALSEGWFNRSVVPVTDRNGVELLAADEHPRPGTTAEGLAKLRPSFAAMGENFGFNAVALQQYPELERITHVHHAGNSSGIVDGAAAVLLGNAEAGARQGLKPRARIKSFASIGSEPCIMLTGPAPASRRALKRAGMDTADIDLWEINEAFAAVVMLAMKELNIPHDKVNVAGGSIALGHPLGATGAVLLATALDELERRDLNTALVTLCVGAGMGTATIIERL